MQKVIITGQRRAEVVEVPDPRPIADWALVKVHIAPMCTEYKSYLAGQRIEHLGHEAVGEVVAVAGPCKVTVGDRVVVMPQYPCGSCAFCLAGDYIYCEHVFDFKAFTGCEEGRATMAQYVLKPSWLLPKIPTDISYERASLALCALGPSFGAFERMNLDAFKTVVITGAGPVGLGAVVNARFRGARVIVVESEPYRCELATQMGAEAVINPSDGAALKKIKEITDGAGADCAIDCAGNIEAERFCIDAVCRRGCVAFIGECGDDLKIRVSPELLRKGLTIVGSWHYNLNDYRRVMQVIRQSPLVAYLISHVFPLSRINDAFEACASHKTAKVLLKPWE